LAPLLQLPGVKAHVLDITVDIPLPTILVLLDTALGITVGAACRSSVRAALTRALIEAHQSLNYLLDSVRSGAPIPDPGNLRDFKDHMCMYRDPAYRGYLSLFLDDNGGTLSSEIADRWDTQSEESELGEVVSQLSKVGFELYEIDLTPPEVGERGWTVLRMMVPGLQPLTCGLNAEHGDPRRLRQVARYFGHPWNGQCRPNCHPFP
jgi:thiazole/oxazole-forming peptide maturase SagD family component